MSWVVHLETLSNKRQLSHQKTILEEEGDDADCARDHIVSVCHGSVQIF